MNGGQWTEWEGWKGCDLEKRLGPRPLQLSAPGGGWISIFLMEGGISLILLCDKALALTVGTKWDGGCEQGSGNLKPCKQVSLC